MKIAFMLGAPTINGGTFVIYEHATRLKGFGHDVSIICNEENAQEKSKWHPSAWELNWYDYKTAKNQEFDVAIGTYWRLNYDLSQIYASNYIYFVQSRESLFYPESEDALRKLAEATYMFPMPIITEATWLKNYLEEAYGKCVKLVHNGIRKDIYTPNGDSFAQRTEGKLRVMLEGPLKVSYKNVEKTLELCRRAGVDEIWLLTSSKIDSYPGVDRVFSNLPPKDAAKVFRSCDVIVKLTYLEGMFGPPLEMFHCGGTAITYDVMGHDEYMKDGFNGFVVKTDDEQMVVDRLIELKQNPKVLSKLKLNALKTANDWIDWQSSSKRFENSLIELVESGKSKVGRKEIEVHSKFYFDWYEKHERLLKSSPVQIASKLKKYQKLSRVMYKVGRKLGIVK